MCGRSRIVYGEAERTYLKALGVVGADDVAPGCHYENFSPGQTCPVIVPQDDSTESSHGSSCRYSLNSMVWGLITAAMLDSKPDHFKMFNARMETVAEKISFKALLSKGQRCVMMCNGFYEWKTEAGVKQPYYVYDKSGRPLMMAALFGKALHKEKSSLSDMEKEGSRSSAFASDTFTVLTSNACSKFDWLHDRQPICLVNDEAVRQWLDPSIPASNMLAILSKNDSIEAFGGSIAWHAVTTRINSMGYNNTDCSTAIKVTPKIGSFFRKSPVKSPLVENKLGAPMQTNEAVKVRPAFSAGIKSEADFQKHADVQNIHDNGTRVLDLEDRTKREPISDGRAILDTKQRTVSKPAKGNEKEVPVLSAESSLATCFEAKVSRLSEMGFPMDRCTRALQANNGDEVAALNSLLTCDADGTDVPSGASMSIPISDIRSHESGHSATADMITSKDADYDVTMIGTGLREQQKSHHNGASQESDLPTSAIQAYKRRAGRGDVPGKVPVSSTPTGKKPKIADKSDGSSGKKKITDFFRR
jgi:putative SOS response-associated peptidase YedK